MKCSKCGRTMVVRTGKSGKFYGCPGYPQCKSTAPYKEVRTPQVRAQREWSNFQLDIFDAVGRSDDNLLVEATAGSGKTSTSVEALNYATRYPKVAFVAFNRSIAQDFKAKVPDGVHASTYHALGLKSIMQARGNEVKVEETKNFKLFTQFTDQMSEVFKSTATDYRSEILRLVGLAKNVMLDVTGTESFRTLADEYGIDIGDDTESGLVLDLAFKVYKASVEDNSTIDFDDMIHWCATGKVEPLAFDFVVTDEAQDMNGARIQMLLRMLRNGGRSMVVGDRKQCVIDGTEISRYNTGGLDKTSCTGGSMIAENIVSGTNIMTAVGGSKVSSGVVQDVYRKKVVDKPVITITTKSGKTLTATSDHVIFSDFVNTKQTGKHYTYLMKKGDWYRVGRAAWYRSVPGKNKSGIIPGFKGRGNQEKADAMWILNISDSRSEAQYWEQYYSIVYGIPTWLFRVDGRGYDLSYDNNFINRLFTSVDTKSAGEKLLSDKGYDINRPHYSPKSTNKRRRRNFSIGLCSDSRHNPLHRYSVSGSDDEDKEKLLNVGLNARTIGGDRNGWRVEGITGDLGKIYDILDLVKSALGEVNVIESGVFGGHQSLRMFPMSQVLVGMNVYVVNDEGVVEYDEVVSRKDWNYTGFVNDFNISGTHNYVAGGIVVHNCIYSWAGASEGAMDIIKRATNARELPLSITYRCPVSHVKLAQELVPQIQARPNAPEGILGNLKPWELTRFVRDGDMVMCRTNAPLVRPAFEMLAQGKKAIIVGRDIGSNMVNLIDRIAKKNDISDANAMLDELTKYIDMQVYRLEKTGKMGKAAMLRDQLETIEAISEGCTTVDGVNRKITDIFSDDRAGVRFSSCHRSKGLEAERTFVLRPELMPHPMAHGQQAMESEMNVKYVSLTRSKSEMYFVA